VKYAVSRHDRMPWKDYLRSRRKLTTAVTIVVALVACSMLWTWTAVIRGRLAAHLDIARGHYELLGYGLPPPWRPEYARLLHERYDIGFRPVAGCIVSQSLVSYVGAYDDVSSADAIHKFGHDVFKESAAEARTNGERTAATVKKR